MEAYIPCRCGERMIRKTNQMNQNVFFGCVSFPTCKQTLSTKIARLRWYENGSKVVRDYDAQELYLYRADWSGEVSF